MINSLLHSRKTVSPQSGEVSPPPQLGQATDLTGFEFPDSSSLLNDRFNKYLQLITTLQIYTETQLKIAYDLMKHYEGLNKQAVSSMPNFETNAGGADSTLVSGSQKIGQENVSEGNDGNSPTQIDLNNFLSIMRRTFGNDLSNTTTYHNKLQMILPKLKSLGEQVEKNQKEFVQTANIEQKDITVLREHSNKSLHQLSNSVQDFKNSKDADYKKDPYLVKRNLLKDATLQLSSENNRIEFLINTENQMHATETKILVDLKNIFNQLSELVNSQYTQLAQNSIYLNTNFDKVSEDLEWNNFLTKNSKFLLTSPTNFNTDGSLNEGMSELSISNTQSTLGAKNSPFMRSIDQVTFPNYDNPVTRPLIEGVLQKKEKTLGLISGGYKSRYYAISPKGFFYEFPARDVDATTPTLALYLPDCEVKGGVQRGNFKFSIRGKDHSNLAPSIRKRYVFQASSDGDYNQWWSIISQFVNSTSGVISSDGSDVE